MTNDERDKLITKTATQMADVHRALFGNGQRGIVERVTTVEGRVGTLENGHKARMCTREKRPTDSQANKPPLERGSNRWGEAAPMLRP